MALQHQPQQQYLQDKPIRLDAVDGEFRQVGCLGHGVSSSAFLAQRQSGRLVVLKMARGNDEDDDQEETLKRELAALKLLNVPDQGRDKNRDLSIVFLRQPIIDVDSTKLTGLVLQHVHGGTLAQEIAAKVNDTFHGDAYTERRIAWYALQLCDALAFCHERGVHHLDVKSSNIMVDQNNGGNLVLIDFGSAISKDEEPVGFSELYAAPELLAAYKNNDLSGLDAEKLDAFGLGCILFELLCCRKLVDLTQEDTLAEWIAKSQTGGGSFFDLSCIRLPWLPPGASATPGSPAGYSHSLKCVVEFLLQPNPQHRGLPRHLATSLRHDALSPVIANYLTASRNDPPGSPVTVDNVRLGMLVQRGPDWDDGDSDGGLGKIGVVCQLEPDANFVTVAWPVAENEPMFCRIGASGSHELQIGPNSIPDCEDSSKMRTCGLVENVGAEHNISKGQMIDSNWMVVATIPERRIAFIAPTQQLTVAPLPLLPTCRPFDMLNGPREITSVPNLWEDTSSTLVEVIDVDECRAVSERFFSTNGGMDIQAYEIECIHRVQSEELWKSYSACKERIAYQNWGMPNERRVFYGSRSLSPTYFVESPSQVGSIFREHPEDTWDGEVALREHTVSRAVNNAHILPSGSQQIVQLRVSLGRVHDPNSHALPSLAEVEYHSNQQVEKMRGLPKIFWTISDPTQVYPEYIVTFKTTFVRRTVRARRPGEAPARPRQGRALILAGIRSAESMLAAHQNTPNPPPPLPPPSASSIAQASASAAAQSNNSSSQQQHQAKMCVICLSKEVSYVLVPCGHPCLCGVCSTNQGLTRMSRKCPECRQPVDKAIRFFGKVYG